MSSSILRVKGLTKVFKSTAWFGRTKEFLAVNNISFEVQKGELVGLLGPNGAGKSTTMQMLLDALSPTAGEIVYFGQELSIHRVEIMQN